jgi:hypothetical protein
MSEVLKEGYDAPEGGGYAGVEQITSTIETRFYWPHMSNSVQKWINGCDTCL